MNLSVGEKSFSPVWLLAQWSTNCWRHVDLVLSIGATGEYH
jgi:hypothetical protein